jgi:hypothetical protein
VLSTNPNGAFFLPNQSTSCTAFGPAGTPLRYNDTANTGAIPSSGNNDIGVTSNNTGGGSHNNVERSLTVNWGQKL